MPVKPLNVLFVCSQNKLRSPTAEQVFSTWEGLEVLSAGTNNDACTPLDRELVQWADVVMVMEREHRSKLQRKFRSALGGRRVICLDIPDDYEFMQPELISLLEAKVPRLLPGIRRPTAENRCAIHDGNAPAP
ncbi:low molecular weight protein tyrosine phosphatase family protein [Rhizobium sp. BK176]|uniref:low molecular weight protein tyrosine phosphatase family protein n=1 Tax=Rhizobium sp. BK176 TaxID=2587071 RepID=UPI00216A68F5|nr:low molecular weight protein tyrosine phosphatase family protein [Rhizobium sp. BK176]